MAKNLTFEQLRNNISNIEVSKDNAFSLVKSICSYINSHQQNGNTNEIHELVLRLKENEKHFKNYKIIIDGLLRKIGLFPYLDANDLNLADSIAFEFHRPLNMELDNVVFHRVQGEVYRDLLDGKNVILSAPTSFGKSLIIDAIIAKGDKKNIVVVVPTIALIDETRRRLSKFSAEYKIITHSFQKKGQKNIFILTQERVVENKDVVGIDFFVIDEFYKLNPEEDNERSVILNQAFYKLYKQGAQFYMLGPNIKSIPLGFSDKFKCTVFITDYSTVVSETHHIKPGKHPEKKLVELCKQLNEPTLIFCGSPKKVRNIAKELIQGDINIPNKNLDSACEWIAREYHPDWQFLLALKNGIGLHHGRLPRSLAQYIVRIFNEGLVNYLICTSTLIEGVNTSAKNVIIFDNKIALKKYDYFTFNNIRGRSGRMFQHFIGNVYLFYSPPQEEFPFVDIPVYSQDSNAPENLLLQIEEEDLNLQSKDRIESILEQNILDIRIIRENSGIDPEDQINLANDIFQRSSYFESKLIWNQFPTYDQLHEACKLIWKYFVKSNRRIGGIGSAKQLTYKINNLRTVKSVSQLIKQELNSEYFKNNDDAIESVFEFLRTWANFKFPKYLKGLNKIQKSVLRKLGKNHGDYDFFANQVENLFIDPAIFALEEYGIPFQIGRKLEEVFKAEGDLDKAITNLKKSNLEPIELTNFEREIIYDSLKYM